MTRAEEIREIAEETHLPVDEVAAVLDAARRLRSVDDPDDRSWVPLSELPLTKGEHDGWPVGTRGEAVES